MEIFGKVSNLPAIHTFHPRGCTCYNYCTYCYEKRDSDLINKHKHVRYPLFSTYICRLNLHKLLFLNMLHLLQQVDYIFWKHKANVLFILLTHPNYVSVTHFRLDISKPEMPSLNQSLSRRGLKSSQHATARRVHGVRGRWTRCHWSSWRPQYPVLDLVRLWRNLSGC